MALSNEERGFLKLDSKSDFLYQLYTKYANTLEHIVKIIFSK